MDGTCNNRINRLLVTLLAISALTLSRWCSAKPNAVSLPAPPQQDAPWTPPAGFSSNLISTATTLFDEGFPDPRGCEYVETEVEVSSVWGAPAKDRSSVKTHAWAIPIKNGSNYVICWNGVIYPAKKIGARANLQNDLATLPTNNIFIGGVSETRTVFASNAPPQALLILLRLGETNVAPKFLEACSASRFGRTRSNETNKGPYLDLASDWAWAMFDHVICAHMRGDVFTALSSTRELTQAQQKIEAEAAKRDFKYAPSSSSGPSDKAKPKLYLEFLEELPRLLADLERRAMNPKRDSLVERGLAPTNAEPRHIAELIEDMDMINERQFGQPGGVNLGWDKTVKSLIHIGDPAVNALIRCLETDDRLTRSVSFHRDFFRNRHIIPVRAAAAAALRQILLVEFRTPAEFKAYWNKYRGLKIEDRWYAILRDDGAQPSDWLQAARSIMQPENITAVPGSGYSEESPLKPGEKPKFRGEALRQNHNPSVTQLLTKRAEPMIEPALTNKYEWAFAIQPPLEFLTMLSDWGGSSNAVPAARKLMQRALEMWANPQGGSSYYELARYIPQLVELRFKGGDTNVLAEYADWLQTLTSQNVNHNSLSAFEPLTRHADDARLAAISEKLLNDPKSPWGHLPWPHTFGNKPLESNLVNVPAFRRMLIRELNNRTVVGELSWNAQSQLAYRSDSLHESGSQRYELPTTAQPPVGTTANMRMCDWVLVCLSDAKRIPVYNPFSTEAERDKAIESAKRLLAEWK